MNRKDTWFFVVIFIILALLSGLLTYEVFAKDTIQNIFSRYSIEKRNNFQYTKKCLEKSPLDLSGAQSTEIQALSAYQGICGSFVTNKVMVFFNMEFLLDPVVQGRVVAQKLLEFKKYGIQPIVIIEPVTSKGNVSWKQFAAGTFNSIIDQFYRSMKETGLVDSDLGIWTPFPEPNIPNWGVENGNGEDFANSVNSMLGRMKLVFPQAKGSVLLNVESFDSTDLEYENGDYLSLSPYVAKLDRRNIDTLGIQGFPWVSAADVRRREIFDPGEFLNSAIIIDALKELRIKDLWINTGSFASKYTNNQLKKVDIQVTTRKKILESIITHADDFLKQGYRVSINLFAKDKSQEAEATNWSYITNEEQRTVFRDFVKRSDVVQVPISIFDR